MMKWFVMAFLFVLFQVNAHAMNLDSYIDYTGTGTIRFRDAVSTNNVETNSASGGIGGGPFNGSTITRAVQFTVSQPVLLLRLSVDASAIPYSLNYPQVNDPTGPAQSMNVFFNLYNASIPTYNEGGPQGSFYQSPDPNALVLSTDKTFTTKNSVDTRKFNNVKIPFKAELTPGNTYWLELTEPQHSGVSLSYKTAFDGKVVTPEPATFLLLGGGLAGAIWRRRKISKV